MRTLVDECPEGTFRSPSPAQHGGWSPPQHRWVWLLERITSAFLTSWGSLERPHSGLTLLNGDFSIQGFLFLLP